MTTKKKKLIDKKKAQRKSELTSHQYLIFTLKNVNNKENYMGNKLEELLNE